MCVPNMCMFPIALQPSVFGGQRTTVCSGNQIQVLRLPQQALPICYLFYLLSSQQTAPISLGESPWQPKSPLWQVATCVFLFSPHPQSLSTPQRTH